MNASHSPFQPNPPYRAKPYDSIRIVGNSNDHPFAIGQVVLVVDWYDFEPEDGEFGVEACEHPELEHWFVRHTDYERA